MDEVSGRRSSKRSSKVDEVEAHKPSERKVTPRTHFKTLFRKNLLVAFREKIYTGSCFLLPIVLAVVMLHREQASALIESKCTLPMDIPIGLPSSGWFRVLQTAYCSYILPCSFERSCSSELYIPDQDILLNFIADQLYRIVRNETLMQSWMNLVDTIVDVLKFKPVNHSATYGEPVLPNSWDHHNFYLGNKDAKKTLFSLLVEKRFLIKAVKAFLEPLKGNLLTASNDSSADKLFFNFVSANFTQLLCDGELLDKYQNDNNGAEKVELLGHICSSFNFTLKYEDLSVLDPQINEVLRILTGLNANTSSVLRWIDVWWSFLDVSSTFQLMKYIRNSMDILKQNLSMPARLANLVCGTSTRLSDLAEKHSWKNMSKRWWTFYKQLMGKNIVLTPLSPVTKEIGDKIDKALSSLASLKWFVTTVGYVSLLDTSLFRNNMPENLNLLRQLFVVTAESFHLFHNETVVDDLNTIFELLAGRDSFPYGHSVIKELVFDLIEAASILRNHKVLYLAKPPARDHTYDRFLAVISFAGIDSNSTTLPSATHYIIHMQRIKLSVQSEADIMHAIVQDLVNSAVLAVRTGFDINIALYAQKFPVRCTNQTFVNALVNIHTALTLHVTVFWMLCLCVVTVNIVRERKIMLREYCKATGLATATYLLSWQLHAFLLMLLPSTIYGTIIIKGNVIEYCSPYTMFFFVAVNSFAVAAQCLAMANCFTSPKLAGLIVPVLYGGLRLLGNFVSASFFEYHLLIQCLLCVIPEFGITVALNGMLRNEERKNHFRTGTMFEPLYDYGAFSFFLLIVMMFLGAIIWLMLAWYLVEIRFSSYSDVKPWYFPFLRAYWASKLAIEEGHHFLDDSPTSSNDYLKHEYLPLPVGLSAGRVSVRCGIGKKAKMVVKDVTVHFYQKEVTAVIGPVGAGKTVLLSVLCGFFPPTRGDVHLMGESIFSHLDRIYAMLGYCPKKNVLLGKLTVTENLKFFGAMKGIESAELNRDVDEVLCAADLWDVRYNIADNLSDILKRKLAIAIALVGKTEVIVIDEPTHGVDPRSRHIIWSLIHEIKRKRTVVLSTPYLDEAEILGDRVAIMFDGELRCCGSSPFLMANNKGGCFLTFVKQPQRNYVPDAEVVQNSHKDIEFKLPITDAVTLLDLVSAVDKSFKDFGCTSYGFSEGGLEDVFRNETMPTGSEDRYVSFASTAGGPAYPQEDDSSLKSFSLSSNDDQTTRKRSTVMISVMKKSSKDEQEFREIMKRQLGRTSGRRSRWIFQIKWMFQRRLIHCFRNWKMIFCSVLLPVSVAAFSFLAASQIKDPYRQLRTVDTLQLHEPSVVFIRLSEQLPENESNILVSLLNNMRTHGMGDQCSRRWCGTPFGNQDFIVHHVGKTESFKCKCVKHKAYCHPKTLLSAFPTYKIRSGQVLVDLTGYCVADWLTMTEDLYSIRRHVGFSMAPVYNKWKRSYTNVSEPILIEVGKRVIQFMGVLGYADLASLIAPEELIKIINIMEAFFGFSQDYYLKIWYERSGTMPYRSSTLYLPFGVNAVANAILRQFVSSGGSPYEQSLTVTFRTARNLEQVSRKAVPLRPRHCSGRIIIEVCGIAISASVLVASFALFVTEESSVNSRQLQYTGGMEIWIYWLAMLIFDTSIITLTATTVMGTSFLFEESFFMASRQSMIASFICYMMFSLSATTIVYLVSNVFTYPSYACTLFAMFNIALELFELVHHLNEQTTGLAVRIVEKVTIFLPHQYFARCIAAIVREALPHFQLSYSLGKIELPSEKVLFQINEKLWRSINAQVTIFTVAFLLLFLYEYRHRICRCMTSVISETVRPTTSEGAIVAATCFDNADEAKGQQGVIGCDASILVLRVANLEKAVLTCKGARLGINKVLDGMTFEVAKGECVGILGHDGAGKSLVFQLLTGNTYQTRGSIIINNRRANTYFFKDIGYCPQNNSLDERLTIRETLRFYAAIRGMTLKETKDAIAYYTSKLSLDSCVNAKVSTLNSCMKRRVSVAVAFIGSPALVLLDEPTAGMDPVSRRCVYRLIINALNVGQSVLFSTNTMEECETLCHRVIVLLRGRFLCIHSVQELKERYARSYTLSVKLQPDHEFQISEIKKAFEVAVSGALFKRKFGNNLIFELPRQQNSLPAIFKAVLDTKRIFQFESYSLKLTPLEYIIKEVAESSSFPEPGQFS
uniref:ABC transporter domain-containing protein n=1 Tax=Trichuris muris TaxID=70415 RepID=A0A5S6QNE0_TRIMR